MNKFSQSVFLFVTLAFVSSVFGKGATVEISITGPGLSTPIHTSDADAIGVSVWGGDFADWDKGAVGEPSIALPRYLVHFWVQAPRSSVVQVKYLVWYVWDSDTQKALIYLPGPRDQWYRTNTYSILRKGRDGHWFYATQDWGEALKNILQLSKRGQPNKSFNSEASEAGSG